MARLFSGTVVTALVAGFVGGMLAPMLVPNGSRSARPLAKGAIKAGLALYELGRERVAELGETASDLVAEVRAEREGEPQAPQFARPRDETEAAAATMHDHAAEPVRGRRYDA